MGEVVGGGHLRVEHCCEGHFVGRDACLGCLDVHSRQRGQLLQYRGGTGEASAARVTLSAGLLALAALKFTGGREASSCSSLKVHGEEK